MVPLAWEPPFRSCVGNALEPLSVIDMFPIRRSLVVPGTIGNQAGVHGSRFSPL